MTEATEGCPARSPKAFTALERGWCKHLCDTVSWIVSGEHFQDVEGTWCRHLISISNPGMFFSKKAITIFNVPLVLQSEVTVVLTYFHGEQIYLTNYPRYYFLLLQKKSQHPTERFTPCPFHSVFMTGHKKKEIQRPHEILNSSCLRSIPWMYFQWRCI